MSPLVFKPPRLKLISTRNDICVIHYASIYLLLLESWYYRTKPYSCLKVLADPTCEWFRSSQCKIYPELPTKKVYPRCIWFCQTRFQWYFQVCLSRIYIVEMHVFQIYVFGHLFQNLCFQKYVLEFRDLGPMYLYNCLESQILTRNCPSKFHLIKSNLSRWWFQFQ